MWDDDWVLNFGGHSGCQTTGSGAVLVVLRAAPGGVLEFGDVLGARPNVIEKQIQFILQSLGLLSLQILGFSN